MLWRNTQDNSVHDDMDGKALLLPTWPKNMVQITQSEADALLAPTAEQLLVKKDEILKHFVKLRMEIISALSMIAGKMQRTGDSTAALACDTALTSFMDIENTPEFIAAKDDKTAQTVIRTAYQTIVDTLTLSSSVAASEFSKFGFTYP